MRIFVSFLISAPMIFLIFIVMAHLAPSEANDDTTPEWQPIDFTAPKYDYDLSTKEPRPEPTQPPEPVMPKINEHSFPDETPPVVVMPVQPTLPSTPTDFAQSFPTTGNPGDTERMKGSHEAIPWMITEPRWPLNANTDGKVRFCFTVNVDGRVSNIKLVHSEPGRVFVREARKALRKWKFRPEVEDGQNIARDNMCYTMSFKLEEGNNK